MLTIKITATVIEGLKKFHKGKSMDLKVKHDEKNRRFYAQVEDHECELKYHQVDEQTLDYFSTYVPDKLRGKGIAGHITNVALQYARDNHYKVVPSCPFVEKYVDNHPEYKSLLTDSSAYNKNKSSLTIYWPLLSVIITSLLAGLALTWQSYGGIQTWMHYFMGVFLLMFSTLKLFHPIDFANGFEMYDLIAKRSRIYALCYPLIELLLSLAFLSFFLPILTYLITIIILTIGSFGVIQALNKGLDINCPCMGTVLNVPLSTVTLIEDLGMALMALIMLLMRIV